MGFTENQMNKNMEHEMEAGSIQGFTRTFTSICIIVVKQTLT